MFITLGVLINFSLFGGMYLKVYNSFEPDIHDGVVVKRFVSMRHSSSQAAMIFLTSMPWENVEPGTKHISLQETTLENHQQQYEYYSSADSQDDDPTFYVNAVLTYSQVDELNNTYFRNCTMTVNGYSKRSKAQASLNSVPLGKLCSIHRSKKHHGKYCIETDEWNQSYRAAVALLTAMGGWLAVAISLVTAS